MSAIASDEGIIVEDEGNMSLGLKNTASIEDKLDFRSC